jgi:hypothetical protein
VVGFLFFPCVSVFESVVSDFAMISSLTSFVQSFVQPIGIAPVGIIGVLSFLVIVGLLAGLQQEVKLRKAEQRHPVRPASAKSRKTIRPLVPDF